MVDTPKRLAKFRTKYNFPDDVEVSYCLESEAILSKRGRQSGNPTRCHYRGRVRIPMSDLITNFLRHFKVCADQCTPNVFRIVSSVDTLNKRLGLKFTKHDINFIYSFQDSKTFRFYFKI